MTPRTLPITKPCFDEEDFDLVTRPLKSGWVVQGPFVAQFEQLFARFAGVRHAVASSNCTTALHLALLASGLCEGDEALVPSFTYVATANAVEYCGAKVRFCDIDLRTFPLEVTSLPSSLTERTRAILPVSLFGLPADLPGVQAICEHHGLFLLEDAACATGATINGVHCGNWGNGGAFSFHPRKAITTGEGGMFVTADDALAAKVRSLRDHGAGKSDLQRHAEKGGSLLPTFEMRGYNYRLTDIQGALGVGQMHKLERILAGRRRGAGFYLEALSELPFLLLPHVPTGYGHGYQSFVCLLTARPGELPTLSDLPALNIRRNKMMALLEEAGVSVRQGTHAVHTLDYYRRRYNLSDEDFPNSLLADRLSITLPLFHDFTAEDATYVAENLLAAWRATA